MYYLWVSISSLLVKYEWGPPLMGKYIAIQSQKSVSTYFTSKQISQIQHFWYFLNQNRSITCDNDIYIWLLFIVSHLLSYRYPLLVQIGLNCSYVLNVLNDSLWSIEICLIISYIHCSTYVILRVLVMSFNGMDGCLQTRTNMFASKRLTDFLLGEEEYVSYVITLRCTT